MQEMGQTYRNWKYSDLQHTVSDRPTTIDRQSNATFRLNDCDKNRSTHDHGLIFAAGDTS